MPYIKYKIYKDLKCPACGNNECIKIPRQARKTIMGSYLDSDPEVLIQLLPAICLACGCMFVKKDDLNGLLSADAYVEREDKKENQSQDSVDKF